MSNHKNIPVLRFPEFKENWEKKKLGDIAKFSKGKGISKIDVIDDGVTDCIRYGELYTRYKEVISEVFSKTNVDISNLILSEANDVIIPASGETQIDIATASCVIKSGIALGGDLNIIKTEHNGIFLSYYLNNRKKLDIASLAQGASVVHLYSNQLATLLLNLPPIPEQTRIASFFTAIDKKIEALKQKKNLLEQYKKGIMQKIFSHELRFIDENGNEFPEWEKKKLKDIAKKRTIKNRNNEVLNVFTNSASQGIVNQRDYFDKDIANQNNLLNYYIVEKDNFIYNPRISNFAPVGPISRNRLGIGVMSPLYSVFKIIHGNLDFFEAYFSTSNWHEFMESIANYGARYDRMSITTIDFYQMPLPFPCIAEQTKIANFLSALDDKINHTKIQLEKAEQWKKGLLQQMFC